MNAKRRCGGEPARLVEVPDARVDARTGAASLAIRAALAERQTFWLGTDELPHGLPGPRLARPRAPALGGGRRRRVAA